MRLLPSRVSGRAWWGLFALLIAAPALALAWLGLRAVRAERIEAEQQLRTQQRQLAQLADAAVLNALTRLEVAVRRELAGRPGETAGAVLPPGATPILFHRSGLVTFWRDRVYFGPFGRMPPERARLTDWPAPAAHLIDEAQAAEIQHRLPQAAAQLGRIGGLEPRLQAWSAVVSARMRLPRDPSALADISSARWAESDGVTPSGLPVAFVASAASERQPSPARTAFVPLIRATLAGVRGGRWWLSADERRFYDGQLRALLEGAGAGAQGADARLADLEDVDHIVRQSPPSRRNGPTHALERGAKGASLIVWTPSETDQEAWLGVALKPSQAGVLISSALDGLFAGQPFSGAVRDATGTFVWRQAGTAPSAWHVEPLRTIRGWDLTFSGPTDRAAATRRQWLWYVFVSLLLVMLLGGIGMTTQVVRREMELARMQSEFVGAVSHEFKSPITSIRLLLERVASGRLTSTTAASTYYAAIEQETDRLERLVNRLLEAQQIEAGRRQYSFAEESLATLTGEVVQHLQAIAEAKNIRIDVDVEDRLPEVRIDRATIADAIENLVENAIKYSRGGTRVRVRLRSRENGVSVDVADEGIGIDQDELPRVFDKFYRARRGDLQNVRGTGLGLALVKAAAEAHGGRVHVESRPGIGSRFSLWLPAHFGAVGGPAGMPASQN